MWGLAIITEALAQLFTFIFYFSLASKFENREKLTGGHKSPMETPAPRKVVPKPTHWTSSSKAIKPQRTSFKTQGEFFDCKKTILSCNY